MPTGLALSNHRKKANKGKETTMQIPAIIVSRSAIIQGFLPLILSCFLVLLVFNWNCNSMPVHSLQFEIKQMT